jgi:hypothetical protein
MAFSMTTAQYATFTTDFDRYRQVYEMFAGNTDAQYEVFSLDHLNRTIAQLEYELAQRQCESRQRLDSLLDHDANGGQFLRTLFLEHTSTLSDGDILSASSSSSTSSYNPNDLAGTSCMHSSLPLPRHTSPGDTKENPMVLEDDDGWTQNSATGLRETSRVFRRFSPHSSPISTSSDLPLPLLLPSPFLIQKAPMVVDDDGDDDDGHPFCSCCLCVEHPTIYCSQYECRNCRLLAPGHKANDCQYLLQTH